MNGVIEDSFTELSRKGTKRTSKTRRKKEISKFRRRLKRTEGKMENYHRRTIVQK